MPAPNALPHPEGWKFLGQTRENREMGEINGQHITAHFLFNNYYRSHDEAGNTRLMLMQIQVHE